MVLTHVVPHESWNRLAETWSRKIRRDSPYPQWAPDATARRDPAMVPGATLDGQDDQELDTFDTADVKLGAPPVLKHCTSCRQMLDAYFAFTIGRRTCRTCLEKHRVHQAEKRKAAKALHAQTADKLKEWRSSCC